MELYLFLAVSEVQAVLPCQFLADAWAAYPLVPVADCPAIVGDAVDTLLLPFSAVTENPSGNSKDTLLLISREINNPPANGLEFELLFRHSKHRFPMPSCPKEERE